MNNNISEEKTSDNIPILDYLLPVFLFCAVMQVPVRIYLNPYWMNKQARIQVQNPDNLKVSCVSFVEYTRVGGRTSHPATKYSVDGIEFDSFSMTALDNFPASEKKFVNFIMMLININIQNAIKFLICIWIILLKKKYTFMITLV